MNPSWEEAGSAPCEGSICGWGGSWEWGGAGLCREGVPERLGLEMNVLQSRSFTVMCAVLVKAQVLIQTLGRAWNSAFLTYSEYGGCRQSRQCFA